MDIVNINYIPTLPFIGENSNKQKHKKTNMDTQYMVAGASTNAKLVEQVQSRINEGWILQGGVSVALGGQPYFAQALIKKSN